MGNETLQLEELALNLSIDIVGREDMDHELQQPEIRQMHDISSSKSNRVG